LSRATRLDIDNALGFTLQAGVDVEMGGGWYLNADVKKTWLDADAKWERTAITADVTIDPWIFSANVGYRFNLSDLFGRRHHEPMK
jgi:outer membrane protein